MHSGEFRIGRTRRPPAAIERSDVLCWTRTDISRSLADWLKTPACQRICRTDLPEWAYTQLAADPVPWIHKFVASNPSVPERLLWTLALDQDADVIGQLARSVARHPNLPTHLITELLDDPDLFVAEAAAANPALPTAIMESLLPSGRKH